MSSGTSFMQTLQRLWPKAGLLTIRWRERIMASTASSASDEPKDAIAIYVTFQDGEAVLCIAPGDHSVQRWRLGKNFGKRMASDLVAHFLTGRG